MPRGCVQRGPWREEFRDLVVKPLRGLQSPQPSLDRHRMPSHAQKKSPFEEFVKAWSESVKRRLTPVFIGDDGKNLPGQLLKRC
jgi:hypothetical protein